MSSLIPFLRRPCRLCLETQKSVTPRSHGTRIKSTSSWPFMTARKRGPFKPWHSGLIPQYFTPHVCASVLFLFSVSLGTRIVLRDRVANVKELLVQKIGTRQESGRCSISAVMPYHGMLLLVLLFSFFYRLEDKPYCMFYPYCDDIRYLKSFLKLTWNIGFLLSTAVIFWHRLSVIIRNMVVLVHINHHCQQNTVKNIFLSPWG